MIDTYIGKNIRSIRHKLGMNQTDLGKKIGVTFQQVQKYEKGTNKIVASKLFDLANKMDVEINYFFDGFKQKALSELDSKAFTVNKEQAEFLHEDSEENSTREAILLVKLYNSIPNKNTRKKLLLFLKALGT